MTSSNNDFILSIQPIKPAGIPDEDSILSAAERLIKETDSWKQGKTYKNVRTYSKPSGPKGVAGWHCRVSEHAPEEATFDVMWGKLGNNKAINEKEYIPEIKKVTKVKELSSTASIWTLYYTFNPFVSPRVFTVLQVVRVQNQTSPKRGMIVSIPIDLTGDDLAKLEEKGVKGRYVSVERLTELEDGRTEWRMATSSTPAGFLPTVIVESTLPGAIAKDVPHFMEWLRGSLKRQ